MKKVITYGTYDLLHQGHINLLRRAKELGDYLIVGVTNDNFDRERGKLSVRNNVLERVEAVKATNLADKVIIEDYVGQKIDDIQKYDVDIFAIGSDWVGKFDYLNEFCKVVYLPRTDGISSTMLRNESQKAVKLGIIGTGTIAHKFMYEVGYVSGLNVCSCYNPDKNAAITFRCAWGLAGAFDDFSEFLDVIDSVYIASPHLTHYDYAKWSLEAGKHVLCEVPFVLNGVEARELYSLAETKKLVLMEANKTAHCPAWNHLHVLAKSGIVGTVVDVKVSISNLTLKENSRVFCPKQAGGSVTEFGSWGLMAIVKLLGVDYNEVSFYSKEQNGVDVFTKTNVIYKNAIASMTTGLGVKTEGNLVISGTKGYILVPSPWWLTDYFEVCYENRNMNKKFFYTFQDYGLRYEIQEFASMIFNGRLTSYRLSRTESEAIADILETYRNRNKTTIIE